MGSVQVNAGVETRQSCSYFSDLCPKRFQIRVVQRIQLDLRSVAYLKSPLQPLSCVLQPVQLTAINREVVENGCLLKGAVTGGEFIPQNGRFRNGSGFLRLMAA